LGLRLQGCAQHDQHRETVHGNATTTASNIAAHEFLFRLGILSDLLCGTVLIFLVLALYRLLKGVDQNLAVLMVILGGMLPATIDFLNVLNDAAAMLLVRGADFLSVFEKPQRDALAMLFLRLRHQEVLAAEILWGLWLFPLAILVYRSRFLPRFLGVWLIINGFAYLTISFTGLLVPQYEGMVSDYAFPRPPRGDRDHAVAPNQGRQAAAAGRRRLILLPHRACA